MKDAARCETAERFPDPSRIPWLLSIARPFCYRLAVGVVCACEQRIVDNAKN